MRSLLLRLYPARWRARYGDEFETLLRERPLGPFDVADILLGALDAHLHLRRLGSHSEHRKGFPMSLRLGGIAATIGGILWFAGFLWTSLDRADTDPGWVVAALGSVALLVGMTGLSAFQARTHPALVWAAFALPAIGGAFMTLGIVITAVMGDRPVAGIYGWNLLIIGVIATFVGSILFALATYRTAALPRSGALILGICAAISLVSFVVVSSVKGPDQTIVVMGLAAFALGWVVLGLQAIRMDRPAVLAGAI